jgi:hypothetical protein
MSIFLKIVLFAVLAVSVALDCTAFTSPTNHCCRNDVINAQHHILQGRRLKETLQCNGSRNDDEENDSDSDSTGTKKDMNILTKSSWYAVEWFGNTFGTSSSTTTDTTENKRENSAAAATTAVLPPPSSLEETIQRINDDNDRSYFLSGIVDEQIYDKDCVFADPFVSFSGRDRFVDNLKNLGSFITKYDAKVIKYNSPVVTEQKIPVVETKIMVKLELNLPWKPVLAWPWGVLYEIDPTTFLITRHEESWNIEPLEGVKMIFRKATVKL